MEKYYRMVINLYKEAVNQNHQVNSNKILDVEKELACAITTAKVKGKEIENLELLKSDVDYLKNQIL